MFYYQTFFLPQICHLLDCSYQIPGKKSGVTVLVSLQTAVKGGHGFEIAVRMDNLRGGDWGEIQIAPIVFEVCTRDQACFRLFLYV